MTTTADFDELKELWQQMDRRLAAMGPALRAAERLGREHGRDALRTRLRFPRFVLVVELLLGVVLALGAGSYLAGQWREPRFAIPALLLHLAAILAIVSPVRQLHALARVDLGDPVVETQRRLAELGLLRARANRAVLFAAPLLWAVAVVAVPHALVGFDVVRAFGAAWVAGNFAFGVVVLALGAWAARRFPASRFLRALGDDLIGRRLAEAAARLGELDELERES